VNKSVNLTKRVKTPSGLRFCTVARSANGRIKANYVEIAGREEHHPEGSYYIEWWEGTKRLRRSVGKNALAAEAKRHQQEQMLTAKADGLKAGLKFVNEEGQVRLSEAVTAYLAETQLTKKPKTLSAYTTALDYFLESCKKQYVAEIERRDMLEYSAFLRDEKEQAARSCWNKFANVMSFLKANGIRGLVKKNDWPRFTEEEPEIYEQEELDKLFAACDAEERLWYEFFLMTGEREQEVMYTYWSDINFAHATVRVTHKPDRGWTPKAYKEREIPIPAKLVKNLQLWKPRSHKKCNLVFPTAGCNPKLNFLDDLKAVAERAELEPGNFWLHKFRATFATRCLWGGVDLRTVQQWLGHSDLESTMRYLKPSRSAQVQNKVNEIFV
jgi:integrase/recombinase XerD